MTDLMSSIYKKREVDLKQNPEAYHKHLHAADLTLKQDMKMAEGEAVSE